MRNDWDDATAPPASQPLAQLVYASRLLGREPSLVPHGGGNSSVKTTMTRLTGEPVDILHVKGSVWDRRRSRRTASPRCSSTACAPC